MSITLSDKSNNKKLIHPITLISINNDKNKFLTLPSGPTNKLSDQNYFSRHNNGVVSDYNNVFFSDEYFFTAVFNANTFDDKIKIVSDIIKANYSKHTVGMILQRLINVVKNINDKKMQDLIKLYSDYYKKYEEKDISYSELYEKIKNLL